MARISTESITHSIKLNSKLNIEWSKNSEKIPTYVKTKAKTKTNTPESTSNQYNELMKILDEHEKSLNQQPINNTVVSTKAPDYTPLENIDGMNLTQLLDIAKTHGFTDENSMSRAVLIDYLQNIIQFVE